MKDKQVGGFEGTLKNIQLLDLIQLCCQSGMHTAIRVSEGSQQGNILIERGQIVHATAGDVAGEEAFYMILAWKSGSFEALGPVSVPETTIERSWEFLLMEGARLIDEKGLGEEMPDALIEEVELALEQDKLRVLIVDDSPMMCRVLKDILTGDKEIDVVGNARNGEEALKMIETLKPDLITLDVNMPVMDGSTALMHIMVKKPCPVVILSSLGDTSRTNIFDFLRLGAVEFMNKPKKSEDMLDERERLIATIKLAATAKISQFKRAKAPKVLPEKGDKAIGESPCESLVVCNSGTGGYAELIKIIPLLPKNLHSCFLVFQRMPYDFVSSLADYLNKRSYLAVLPLETNALLMGGRCYIGAHNFSLKLHSEGGRYALFPEDTRSILDSTRHAFNDFLCSIADSFPGRILVVLLSGADVDDLEGLRRIKERNGHIIAQQTTSCMVPYSLERAIKAQLVDLEANPTDMTKEILHYIK